MVRRLVILLAFGLTHLFLIWNGDILTEYAIVGFAVLPFLYGPRWLLAATSALCLALYVASPLLPPVIAFPDRAWIAHHVAEARQVYGGGGFMQILAFRIGEVRSIAPLHVYVLPRTLGLFLLGAWVWRTGFFRPAAPRSYLVVAACGFLLAIGAWMTLAQLVLACGYGAAIVVLADHPMGRKLVAWAGPVGRMAFTNYIAQSVILSLIFYGFGLALFGQLSVAPSLAIAVLIYAGQAALSAWWLSRFRFGPIEWLWRSLMYGELQAGSPQRLRSAQ